MLGQVCIQCELQTRKTQGPVLNTVIHSYLRDETKKQILMQSMYEQRLSSEVIKVLQAGS